MLHTSVLGNERAGSRTTLKNSNQKYLLLLRRRSNLEKGLDKQQGTVRLIPSLSLVWHQCTKPFHQKWHMQATQNELISFKAQDCLDGAAKRPLRGSSAPQQSGEEMLSLGSALHRSTGAPTAVLGASRENSHLSLNWKSQVTAVLHC